MKKFILFVLLLLFCISMWGYFGKTKNDTFYDEEIIIACDEKEREYYFFAQNGVVTYIDIVEYYKTSESYYLSEDYGYEMLNGELPYITTFLWKGMLRHTFWYRSDSDYCNACRQERYKFYSFLLHRDMTPFRVYGVDNRENKYHGKSIEDVVFELKASDKIRHVEVLTHDWNATYK